MATRTSQKKQRKEKHCSKQWFCAFVIQFGAFLCRYRHNFIVKWRVSRDCEERLYLPLIAVLDL